MGRIPLRKLAKYLRFLVPSSSFPTRSREAVEEESGGKSAAFGGINVVCLFAFTFSGEEEAPN